MTLFSKFYCKKKRNFLNKTLQSASFKNHHYYCIALLVVNSSRKQSSFSTLSVATLYFLTYPVHLSGERDDLWRLLLEELLERFLCLLIGLFDDLDLLRLLTGLSPDLDLLRLLIGLFGDLDPLRLLTGLSIDLDRFRDRFWLLGDLVILPLAIGLFGDLDFLFRDLSGDLDFLTGFVGDLGLFRLYLSVGDCDLCYYK